MATITTRSGKGSPLTNNEVDANFTNLNTDKAELSGATFTGDIDLPDNGKLKLGASDDLQIYHDGNNSRIYDVGTGDLRIQGTNLRLMSEDGANYLYAVQDAYTKLYYNGAEKLATTSTGIDVTGEITADALTINSSGVQIGTILQSTSTISARLSLMDANTTAASQVGIGATGNTLGLYASGGSPKVVVSGTGIDVTGTATMDGLTSHTGSNATDIASLSGSAAGRALKIQSYDTSIAGSGFDINASGSAGEITLQTYAKDRLRIGATGDISFYDDSANAKFFWDASAESLGIGTTSPTSPLTVSKAGAQITGQFINPTASQTARIYVTCGTQTGQIQQYGNTHATDPNTMRLNTTAGDITIAPSSVETVRVTTAGNVGIGTDSPVGLLNLEASSGNSQLYITTNDTTSRSQLIFGDSADANVGGVQYNHSDDSMEFHSGNGGERARITSGGLLLIGTTSTTPAFGSGTGIAFVPTGESMMSANSTTALFLNRTSSDGTILDFRRDGTTVGSIGTRGGDVYVETGDTGIRMYDQSDAIIPIGSVGVSRDAAIDLGISNIRFKDLYLSGGVYLGGTGAANKLDDYEEGTWTPVLDFGGANTGMTANVQVGRYTKIGRMVYSSFNIQLTNKGTSTGDVTVTGSPFSNYTAVQNNAGTVICELGGVDWPQSGVYGMVWSDSKIYLRSQGLTSYVNLNNTHFSNTTRIFGMMVYETT